ncbi:MAG: helix-turn-helix transcriptional regulator [Rhodoferax sp.]|nr:helix-turn-helix transcriptional regulator [Rhodoferax sp.]
MTARELQIYELLANGMSNADISNRLNRSVRTIEHHASKVLAKLGVRSRADLRGLPASPLVD